MESTSFIILSQKLSTFFASGNMEATPITAMGVCCNFELTVSTASRSVISDFLKVIYSSHKVILFFLFTTAFPIY